MYFFVRRNNKTGSTPKIHVFASKQKYKSTQYHYNMRLSTTFMNQLRFNFQKHFIQNPTVKSYTMEALGHKGTQWAGFYKNSSFEKIMSITEAS